MAKKTTIRSATKSVSKVVKKSAKKITPTRAKKRIAPKKAFLLVKNPPKKTFNLVKGFSAPVRFSPVKIIKPKKKPPVKKTAVKPKHQQSSNESQQLSKSFFKARIRVIGIGGGGSSIVSEIGKSLHKATFLVADTDMRSFKKKSGIKRFLLGQKVTHGLGTGGIPELGRAAAAEAKEKIASFFKGQDIVILIACLGGGFGSGAMEVFSEAAKDFNGITFGIFTLPFKFEGKHKQAIASKALKNLRNSLNVSLAISNEKIFNIIDSKVAITQAFSLVNKHLIDLLESLIDLIYNPGIINIDFADVKAILGGRGNMAFLNTAEASGKDRAQEIMPKILHNPLYQESRFTAQKILFNIAGGSDVSLAEINAISRSISQLNPNAKIIFGISKNPKLKHKIKTTLLMTGLASVKQADPKPAASKAPAVTASKQQTAPVVKRAPLSAKSSRTNKQSTKPKKDKRRPASQKTPPKPLPLSPVLMPVFDNAPLNNQFTPVAVKSMDTPPSLINKKAIRRTGLEIQQARKSEETKQSLQEKEWEIPAFLRAKK